MTDRLATDSRSWESSVQDASACSPQTVARRTAAKDEEIKGTRILVIEDDPSLAATIAWWLEDRGAEAGDIAVIDYTSTLDGTPVEEAIDKKVGYIAGREGFWIKIDEESFLPGFTKELEGVNAGDKKEITVSIPEDFPVAELHGKDLLFAVEVKEVKEVTLPELDIESAGLGIRIEAGSAAGIYQPGTWKTPPGRI